jgi:hypothetical protein
MASGTLIAPEPITPETEPEVKKRTRKASAPRRPVPPLPKGRNFLEEIFNGHEEFLGLTSD